MAFDVQGRERTVVITGVTHALVRARGDGNCLFHAAGHGLAVAGLGHAGIDDHARLRTEVVDYIAAHVKETTPLGFKLRDGMGIARNVQGAVTPAQEAAIDRRVELLRRAGSWGDEACLTAIDRLYGVEVQVFDAAGANAVLGVPYYAAPEVRDPKLRLCVRMVGHTPYHYDLYLPDAGYDAERDGGNRVLVAPRKGGLVAQSADEPWAYHLNPKGLHLLTPAMGHRQFAFSRGVIEAKAQKPKPKPRVVEVALGDQPNVVQGPPAPVRAVQVVNAGKVPLASESWSDERELDPLVPVREDLVLPLARVEGQCTNLLDLEHTSLIIDTARGDDRQPALLFVRVYRRGHGSRAAKGGGLLAEVVLDVAACKPTQEELSSPARMRYTFALASVLRKQEAALTWEASPFQLVASSDPDYAASRSAWTHAHVPSEWDVQIAESLAKVAVIPMTDTPSKAVLGGAATVQALANTSIGREAPNGREDFELPAVARAALQRIVAAANLSAFDLNAHNYLVEVAPGRYYLSTSWASMASLQLHEDGHYYLHALYWCGSTRHAYIITADDLAHPDRRGETAGPYNAAIRALDQLGMAIGNLGSPLLPPTERQRFDQLKAKSTYPYGLFRSREQSADYEMILAFEQRYGVVVQRTRELRANRGICDVLLKHGVDARAFTITALDDQLSVTSYLGFAEALSLLTTKTRQTLITARNELTQKGLELPHDEVDGIPDFDTGGGKRLATNITWSVHVFKAPLRLTHVVTAGISSCAGGVTVTSEEVPAYVWLWHLDANLSIPMLADMERLWPKGKDAPPMSTVALVYPSPWELNKYRPDNLYPATVAEKCQSLFYLRGRHFYGTNVVTSAGCNVFGLDLQTERRVDWVFTYDLDNRTELVTNWHALLEASEDAPEVLAHVRDDLYGTYRFDDAAPATTKQLVAYIGRLRGEVDAVKRHKRRTTGKSCRVPSISAATIAALAKGSTPLLACDCIFACEMGDAELSTRPESSVRWVPGSFAASSK